MILNVDLRITEVLLKGLQDGTLERFGGVIREAATGKIRAHLTEVGKLIPNSVASNALGLVPGLQIASIGISAVSFIVLNEKLNKISESLAKIDQNLEKVKDNTEMNLIFNESEILGGLKSAFELGDKYFSENLTDVERRNFLFKSMEELIKLKNKIDSIIASWMRDGFAIKYYEKFWNYVKIFIIANDTYSRGEFYLGEKEKCIKNLEYTKDRVDEWKRYFKENFMKEKGVETLDKMKITNLKETIAVINESRNRVESNIETTKFYIENNITIDDLLKLRNENAELAYIMVK